MRRQRTLPLVLSAAVFASLCNTWMIHTCSTEGPCLKALSHPVSPATIGLVLLGALWLAWMGRTVWLMVISARAGGTLAWIDVPSALTDALHRTGIQSVRCVASSAPVAYCTGALHPRIVVSQGLVRQLQPDALDAVLLHEQQHRKQRDPLRFAAYHAAADVCFFLPLVAWWSAYQGQNAELEADRAAVSVTGPSALARALLAVSSAHRDDNTPAFTGAAELRVAQVLGESLPQRRPPLSLCIASIGGIGLTLSIMTCVSSGVPVLASVTMAA